MGRTVRLESLAWDDHTVGLAAKLLVAQHICDAMPREAVGLLWAPPGDVERVIPLVNHSETPERSYAVRVDELVDAFELATGERITEIDHTQLTLWHSHPSGGVGPSRGDMVERAKTPLLRCMVISVTDDSFVTTVF